MQQNVKKHSQQITPSTRSNQQQRRPSNSSKKPSTSSARQRADNGADRNQSARVAQAASRKAPVPGGQRAVASSRAEQQAANYRASILDKTLDMVKGFKRSGLPSKADNAQKPQNEPMEKRQHYSQDVLGIREIAGGMVFMDNGKIVGIQEVLPVNFYQKTPLEQDRIAESYRNFFRVAPDNLHFKLRTEKADTLKIKQNILDSNQSEYDDKIFRQMNDYIDTIDRIQGKESLRKRFYVMWEYEGDAEGKKSNDIEQILWTMEDTRLTIRNSFADMGNNTIVSNDMNYDACEMLYKFFNPKTSMAESFDQRILRIADDAKRYNADLDPKMQRQPGVEDYIAPKGLTVKPNYIIMDGVYHTYLTLCDNGHPGRVVPGWADLLGEGLGYDLDIFVQKLPYNSTLSAIEQYNRINRVRAKGKASNPEKFEEMVRGVQNKKYITDMMRRGDEDLWNCLIIITIRANSYRELSLKKSQIIKRLKSNNIYTEDSFMRAFRIFKMTVPLMHIDKQLFKKNKRNYLTSSLSSLYNYTAYELFDETGAVLGVNHINGSLVAVNPFNTNIYSNANILLLGSSGSGKTFTELMLARRMRLTGCRTYFILPIKGHEYADMIKAMGGEYVTLFPGGKTCINIMHIRPETEIDKELLQDVAVEKASLLSKKITSITTFIQLLMRGELLSIGEINRLNGVITEIYDRFEITHDNDSIYRDKKNNIFKQMPTLQNLYDALERDDYLHRLCDVLMPFIEGSCQNFNGQTNIRLNNKCLAFDIDEDVVGEVFLPAFMFIAFDLINDIVKQDMLSTDIVFADEAWKMMQNEQVAKQVMKMVKLIRGYAGSVCIASQDIEDFIHAKDGFGASVISNTEIKIFKKMKENEVKALSEVFNLTEDDKLKLMSMKREFGFIYSNNDKVLIRFKASAMEEALFTTDVNVKKRIAAEQAAMKKKRMQRKTRSNT